MVNCLQVQSELEAYVDGELSPDQAARMERHLAECDDCQAELARLRAVVVALETWPLVSEPARLTAHVMTRVRPRPALPAFRLRWSDLAISLAGSGLAFTAMLIWRYLASTEWAYLYHTQTTLRLEMLRLELLLQVHRLAQSGAGAWGLISLVGAALIVALAFVVRDRASLYPTIGSPGTITSSKAGL